MPKSQKKKKSVKKKTEIESVLETAEEKIPAEIILGIGESEFEIEDLADVSEERASIISIVKGLEGQVETAFKLKEVLEAELDTTQQRLSEEMEARAQLEVQVNSLQAQAALAEQLRQDIFFTEEERNKFADELAQTQREFEQAAAERDSLTEQFSYSEANLKELESDKMALEAQVMNLKDNITDADRLRKELAEKTQQEFEQAAAERDSLTEQLSYSEANLKELENDKMAIEAQIMILKDNITDADRLRKELAEITQAHRQSREQTHDLTRQLETAKASKNALETQLAGIHQNAQTLRVEAEQLRRKVADGESRTANLRIQLDDQQATNRELIESNMRLENETKMANINYEAARNELGAFKNALRDIRSEAARTSGRVRQRYFKPKHSVNPSHKTETKAPKTKKKPAQSPAKKKKIATPKKKTTRRKTKNTAKN